MGPAAVDHPEPWSEEQYFALPYTGQRHELIDGVLMMSPAPNLRHQRISQRLWQILDLAIPVGHEVHGPINVRLAPDRVVIPDVAVLTNAGGDGLVVPAAEVLVMVEVVSPSTRRIDRVLKPSLAAEAGIPYYILVEPDDPTVIVHELVDDAYRAVTSASGAERLSVTDPFPMDFRPAELLASRRA